MSLKEATFMYQNYAISNVAILSDWFESDTKLQQLPLTLSTLPVAYHSCKKTKNKAQTEQGRKKLNEIHVI